MPTSSPTRKTVDLAPAARPWYTHNYNRPAIYSLLTACTPYVPRPLRFGIAQGIAWGMRRLMRREDAAVRRNMAHVLPHAAPEVVSRTVHTLFRNFAWYFADLVSLNRQASSAQQRYVHHTYGLEHIRHLLAADQGFIAATAHLGNWELAGRLITSLGKTMHVLMAPEQHASIQRLLRERNTIPGLHFVSNHDAGAFMRLLLALRRGEVVGVQTDRSTGHRSDLAIPFFGTPAFLPSGPYVLAAAAGVPVVPAFCLLRPDHRYDIFVEPPIPVRRGHEAVALQAIARVLERYIAMAPDQWFNFYDVWHHPSTA